MVHFLSVGDLRPEELTLLLEHAGRLKRAPETARLPRAHAVALLFQRPSLRTRLAYEAAVMHLGGQAIALEGQLGRRESVADVARTLSRMVSLVVARVGEHALLEELSAHAEIPVINALSDREHPVEVLADALTLQERWGDLHGRRLTYLGDGNNICHSLLLLAPLAGMDISVASPAGYAPAAAVVQQALELAAGCGTRVEVGTDPGRAAAGADAVYTDVWASMGQEEQAEERRRLFQPYQVNRELLSLAHPDAVVLHCLPARRGEEISAEVLDGPQSLAFHRLANLVPVSAAVLHRLLAE